MNTQNNFNVPNDINSETYSKQTVLSEDDIKKLNIPPRDEVSYPMPSKEEIEAAGQFLFKLNLLASSLDLNLQALVWNLYIKMDDFLHRDTEGASVRLAIALEELKEYLITSNNPVFKDNGNSEGDK